MKRLARLRDRDLRKGARYLAAVAGGSIARGRGRVLGRGDAVASSALARRARRVGPFGNHVGGVDEPASVASDHGARPAIPVGRGCSIERATGQGDVYDAIQVAG